MKKIVLSILILFPAGFIQAQKYDTIQVGLSTAVHLIFESNIIKTHIGLGTKEEAGQTVTDILLEDPAGGPRLTITAAIEKFERTNLYVETEDGHYNFILEYAKWPRQQLIPITIEKAIVRKQVRTTPEQSAKAKEVVALSKETKLLEVLAKDVLEKGSTMDDVGEKTQKMEYYLNAIYVKDSYYFFRVTLVNKGAVKYDLGFEGFFIRDKKAKGVNQAPQQVEDLKKKWLYTLNDDVKTIQRKESVKKVYVFEKFTLDPDKHFSIEFWEDEGQRKVEIKLSAKDLLNAKPL